MKINRSIQFIGRLITAIIILGITAFFTPGFSMESIWILIGAILIFSASTIGIIVYNIFSKI